MRLSKNDTGYSTLSVDQKGPESKTPSFSSPGNRDPYKEKSPLKLNVKDYSLVTPTVCGLYFTKNILD